MKIAVIGAKGQLALELQKQREVLAFSKHQIDLLDPLSIKQLEAIDFDVLINAAAYNMTEKAEDEPQVAYRINTHAVKELALISKNKRAIFVHVSSDFVFSGAKDSPYVEGDAISPLSVYAASKAFGEVMALYNPSSYVFRTASLYGEGVNFVRAILKRAREGKELKVIDDIFMSPTHAQSLAQWIYRALDLKIPFGIYHAVNSGGTNWYQFAVSILRKAELKVDIRPCPEAEYPSKIKRPKNSILDNSLLIKHIGPMATWEEALDHYFQKQCANV